MSGSWNGGENLFFWRRVGNLECLALSSPTLICQFVIYDLPFAVEPMYEREISEIEKFKVGGLLLQARILINFQREREKKIEIKASRSCVQCRKSWGWFCQTRNRKPPVRRQEEDGSCCGQLWTVQVQCTAPPGPARVNFYSSVPSSYQCNVVWSESVAFASKRILGRFSFINLSIFSVDSDTTLKENRKKYIKFYIKRRSVGREFLWLWSSLF